MEEGNILPKVAKDTDGRYEARKSSHVAQFAELLNAPDGFNLWEWPFMHRFHAIVINGEIFAFGSDAWHRFAEQFLLTLPVCTTPSSHVHNSQQPQAP